MNPLIAPRTRARAAMVGLALVVATMPIVLSLWAPTWFVIAWVSTYAVGALSFVAVTLRRTWEWAEFTWSLTVSSLLALVPLSTLVFDAHLEAKWAAAAVVAFHLANVLAARTFMQRGDWRLPVFMLMLSLGITGTIHVSWVLGLAAVLAGVMIVKNAQAVLAETEAIRYERAHDQLTGLLNRRGLLDASAAFSDEPLTVVIVDANRFKQINDTYGYEAGDASLRAIAAALGDRLGSDWLLSRHGGDEFVAIATERGLVGGLGGPVNCSIAYRGGTLDIAIELSIGAANSTGRGDIEAAMSRAGHALRASKQSTDAISYFDTDLEHKFTAALRVGSTKDLTTESALFAVAQPITLPDGAPVGWELLVRWRSEDGTTISPADFLPVLVENGLMPQLNDRMLETGVAFAAQLAAVDSDSFVSVNLTASHLADPDLVDYVSELLNHYDVPPERMMIEITESESLSAFAPWLDTAYGLAALGLNLAIDDFGSGYSSIERMAQLPITHLKFDGSFAAATGTPLGEIISGIVRYADATGLRIIAEGIETWDELDRMRRIGVEYYQGFLLGRPMSLDEAERVASEAAARAGSGARGADQDASTSANERDSEASTAR